jgi:hypothetical protein
MFSFVLAAALAQSPDVATQFNDVCVKSYPNVDAIRAAARKAGWKQKKTPSAEDLASGNWSESFEISESRTLSLHSDDKRTYCSIVFGDEAMESKSFIAAVEKTVSGVRRDKAAEDNWNKVGMEGTGNSAIVWRAPKAKKAIVSSLVKKGDLAYDVLIGHPFFVGAKPE